MSELNDLIAAELETLNVEEDDIIIGTFASVEAFEENVEVFTESLRHWQSEYGMNIPFIIVPPNFNVRKMTNAELAELFGRWQEIKEDME